jgi:hypothetical protein
MDVRDALIGQYHAALRMLRQCVELCPDELWVSGPFPREFGKIAYHAAFYGHLYMGQSVAVMRTIPEHSDAARELYEEDAEPVEILSRQVVMDYIDQIREQVDATILALDLETSDSGFEWYGRFNKLEHVILSIRHIQGHVGQLSERLMAAGIETDWISRRA